MMLSFRPVATAPGSDIEGVFGGSLSLPVGIELSARPVATAHGSDIEWAFGQALLLPVLA
jgi:hypothetical protein